MTPNAGATYRSLLITLGALIALPFVMWGGLTWQTGRALQAELDKVKASGAPLTMAQVAPPPVPDNRNAALLYIKALRYLRLRDGSVGQTYRDLAREENPARRRELIAQLRPLLAANRRALDLAAQGARLPASRLPVDWAKAGPAYFSPFLDYTPGLRELARLFAAQAEVESADGRVEDAVQSCLIGLRIGDHVAREPILEVTLSANTMQAIILRALAQVLKEHRVSPALCSSLFKRLGAIDVESRLRRVLLTERAEDLAILDYLQRRPNELEELWDEDEAPNRLIAWLYLSRIGVPLRRSERVYFLRLMDRFITLSRRPYREVRSQLDDIAADADHPPRGYLLGSLVLVSPGVVAARDSAQTRIDAVRIILALKAYQAERGDYPDSLASLRKALRWDLPKDPFSGKDFVYRRKGAGFILYSWGLDLKDDGGTATSDDGSPPDIVWTFTR
jgi:hypothetical protein